MIVIEKMQKKELKEKRKIKTIDAKQHRTRGGISLFSEKKDKRNTRNNTNLY